MDDVMTNDYPNRTQLINQQHQRGIGCGPKAFAAGILLVVAVVVTIAARDRLPASPQPVTRVADQPPATATPILIIADLAHLQETGAALDNESQQLANESTAIVLLAQQAQVTQQAVIFDTQQALAGRYQGMTETVIAGNDAQSTRQAQRTQAAETAGAEYAIIVTKTAVVIQSTQAAATEAALVSQFVSDQIRRGWLEQVAGFEAVFWRIIVPAFILCIGALLAWGAALMWAQRYQQSTQPVAVEPETWEPETNTTIPTAPIQIEIKTNGGKSLQFLELPITPQQARKLVDGALSDKPLSEREWCGAVNPFSVPQFRGIREILMRAGLAQWMNETAHEQGWQLTDRGRDVFETMQGDLHIPSPTPQFTAN